jgi:hypothetical protein
MANCMGIKTEDEANAPKERNERLCMFFIQKKERGYLALFG